MDTNVPKWLPLHVSSALISTYIKSTQITFNIYCNIVIWVNIESVLIHSALDAGCFFKNLHPFKSGDAQSGHWEADHVLCNMFSLITGTRENILKPQRDFGEERFLITICSSECMKTSLDLKNLDDSQCVWL